MMLMMVTRGVVSAREVELTGQTSVIQKKNSTLELFMGIQNGGGDGET
jgi:hypothetical protein